MKRTTFEIQNYEVSMGGLKSYSYNDVLFNYYATIKCSRGQSMLIIYFLAEQSDIPANYGNARADDPDYGRIFVPISQWDYYIDILRNESPVYAHIYEDHPEFMGISTNEEPVGQGE